MTTPKSSEKERTNMAPLVTTEWPSPEEFTLAHSCPRCKAAPGDPCVIRGGRAGQVFHGGRQDLGYGQYRRRGWVTRPRNAEGN